MNNIGLLEDISKSYLVDGQLHKILSDVNLSIDLQGITVILGKSGCGKTTLLRLLADLEPPTTGKITYYDDKGKVYQPKIGMVFQESRLMPWLTVEDNILIHQQKQDHEVSNSLIELMGLDGFSKAYPHELSGGMAHRVAIARALSFSPDLLLMDEPFAALDYFTRMTMQNEVINIHTKTKKAVIFVTHNVDEALILAKNIIILKKGEAPLERKVEKDYGRDLGDEYFVKLKKDILNLLGK